MVHIQNGKRHHRWILRIPHVRSVTASPYDMANGFMEAYNNLPDPLPLSNKSIENRGFRAFQSNVVKL